MAELSSRCPSGQGACLKSMCASIGGSTPPRENIFNKINSNFIKVENYLN